MSLTDYLETRKDLIDDALSRFLPDEPEGLYTAMRYSLLDGGKRIRPVLALAAAEAVGGNIEDVLPAACAVECIHAFSLIHDDLPCMDDDDFRRGKPTNHKVYGEPIALLAGDALLAQAFEILAKTPASVPSEAIVRAIQIVSRAAGAAGMTGGQALDLQAEGKEVALADVEQIHRLKTGALIEASVVAGAIVGGADEAQQEALGIYGQGIGLAFQIVDDLLDLTSTQEKLGKAIGSDLKHYKATYPSLLGLTESMGIATEAVDKATSALALFGEPAEPLRLIARLVIERDS